MFYCHVLRSKFIIIRKDAELLTPDFLKTLASRWASYETEAVRYVDRILGIQTPTTLNMLSISLSGISDKEFKSVNFSTENASDSHALRKFHQLNNDPQLRSLMAPATTEARIETFNALYAKALDDQFYNAIKAPSIIINANRQNFIDSGAQYRQAADTLQWVPLVMVIYAPSLTREPLPGPSTLKTQPICATWLHVSTQT